MVKNMEIPSFHVSMKLNFKRIEAAKPKDKPYKLADGGGLYLDVAKSGRKTWRANFGYGAGQTQKTVTYGPWPEVSLVQARERHQHDKAEYRAAKAAMAAGETPDPAARAPRPTFQQVAQEWMRLKLPSLSNPKHRVQVQNTLERFAYPAIGDCPVDQITRDQLIQVVKTAEAGGRIETAHRVAGRINAVMDFAVDANHLQSHPAAGLIRVLTPRKVKKPMSSIAPEETGALLQAIEGYEEPVTRLGLQMLALTFVRTAELRGMRWSELKEEGGIWVIPAERMKLRLPHVVPLSRQAQQVLQKLQDLNGDAEFVFASPIQRGSPFSENTLLFALYRLGYKHRMTGHGFRALASTVLNEQSGFAHDVIERQLAHKETDAVRAAYNRAQYLEQRRDLMQWWADWLDRQRP